MLNRRQVVAGAAASSALAATSSARAQAKTSISISRQLGVLYIPTHILESERLIEKHAERLGLPGASVNWMSFSSSSAQQDALLSGGVDIINAGAGPLLVMWDRTRGRVKGIVAISAQPVRLLTREDRIRELKDFTANDRIAVPTVRVSTQAILLQMAAAKLFGADKWAHFDPMTIQMGHADALISMRNATHEVRSHFAAPPFDYYGLRSVPGARVVATSTDIIGSPLSQGQFFCTTTFAETNPVLIKATRAATEEAKAMIEGDIRGAVEVYKRVSGDKTETSELVDMFAQPGMMQWELYPQGTMRFAEHLTKVGTLRTMPAAWTDYYLPIAHDLPGN